MALPKLARVLRTCPFKVSSQSPRVLRQLMGDALSDIAGRPLPVWSWLKASLPSSLGWLNLRQASVHASAAYIGSLHQSRHLVAKILGRTAPQSTFPTPSNPWESIQDIDVPLSQHSLSRAIDETYFAYWPLPLTLAPKPLPSQLRSDTPAIGSMLCHRLP